MKAKKLVAVVMATAMALTMMAGCTKYQNKKSQSKDTLIFAQSADPISLDPALISDGESTQITTNIYDGLLQYKKGSTEVEPCLATNWTVSSDGLTYTFTLRKGVKFQDGTDFNAEAVKYNFDRQLNGTATADMSYASFIFGLVKGVEVKDDYTVVIHMTSPNTPFLADLAMNCGAPISSPTQLKKYNGNITEHPCGTGPYTFVKWDKGQDVVLVRNDNYWGTKAKTKNVIFKVIKDASDRVVALNNGEADMIEGVDSTNVDQIKQGGSKVVTFNGMMTNYMAYNTTSKIFASKDARRAVSESINVPELVKSLYKGYSQTATSFLPDSLPGYSKTIQQVQYNPDDAKTTLSKLGITSVHVITYSIARSYNLATGQTLAEAVQGYLSKVGVKCTIDVYDWTTYKAKMKEGNYDICFIGWGGDNGDPDNFMNLFATDDPLMNVSRYKNTTYNSLIEKGLEMPNGSDRNAVYTQCEQMIADDAPILSISHAEQICGVSPYIHNFDYHIAYGPKLAGVTKG